MLLSGDSITIVFIEFIGTVDFVLLTLIYFPPFIANGFF